MKGDTIIKRILQNRLKEMNLEDMHENYHHEEQIDLLDFEKNKSPN